jgi:protein TonB
VEPGALEDYRGSVRARLADARSYPAKARRLRQEGEVLVSFRVVEDGSVEDLTVEETSGFEVLDDAAVRLVESCSPFPLPPHSPFAFRIPVRYRLEELR